MGFHRYLTNNHRYGNIVFYSKQHKKARKNTKKRSSCNKKRIESFFIPAMHAEKWVPHVLRWDETHMFACTPKRNEIEIAEEYDYEARGEIEYFLHKSFVWMMCFGKD
jgi:hypothetical protein